MKVFAILLAIVWIHMMATEVAGEPRASVDVVNWDIDGPLMVHCKSGNDDLQVHTLQSKGDYHFDFHENVWQTTLYWCTFAWGPNNLYWQKLNVWDAKADHPPLNCINCTWRCQKDGVYVYNDATSAYEFQKKWNSVGPPPDLVDSSETNHGLEKFNSYGLEELPNTTSTTKLSTCLQPSCRQARSCRSKPAAFFHAGGGVVAALSQAYLCLN